MLWGLAELMFFGGEAWLNPPRRIGGGGQTPDAEGTYSASEGGAPLKLRGYGEKSGSKVLIQEKPKT